MQLFTTSFFRFLFGFIAILAVGFTVAVATGLVAGEPGEAYTAGQVD
jgi:hypothetical protein